MGTESRELGDEDLWESENYGVPVASMACRESSSLDPSHRNWARMLKAENRMRTQVELAYRSAGFFSNILCENLQEIPLSSLTAAALQSSFGQGSLHLHKPPERQHHFTITRHLQTDFSWLLFAL